ncbi:beta-glucosidase [Marinomonas sp. MED121]|uniref:GH1 family beta-glucosidase n=1 Tax=Marinomonas sp. MED121 TaxID=314277 RepID=UPI0000690F45|nr:GH1 family beta-glucosidase [Marinomonas sp. MED121]EAQ63261.1 beta-glucosidase [Marinomonas sp. MED121]
MSISLPSHSALLKTNFTFGVATAAFQIEGANQLDGRIESIWDRFCATPGKVFNGDDGAIACDHYHKWQEDIELIKSLGVDAYRLSIAWPRLMDKEGKANPKGIAFYRNLLTQLKANQIKTFVTLYHWDLPQHLEERGGWLNRETAYKFQAYAQLAAEQLGQWVDVWTTFNEPWCTSILGYGEGIHAPGLADPIKARQAGHHVLLAHGLAMPILKKVCPDAQAGIVLNMSKAYPADNKASSKMASLYAEALDNHFFIEPLLTGQYPDVIKALSPELIPQIEDGDMAIISQPIDYLGLNYYTCNHAKWHPEQKRQTVLKPATKVEYTHIGWEVNPESLTQLLLELNQEYALPPIYITENGAACDDKLVEGEVHDEQRVRYLNAHLNAIHNAIEAGVNIQGYFAWSLMDNFEWAEGYSKRFGLVYVDYNTQERTLKASAKAYRELLLSRLSVR